LALSAPFAAFSAMSCCVSRLCSRSWSNAPQRVRSAGIGFFATHFALTKPLKSLHGLIDLSSSVTSNGLAAKALPPESASETARASGCRTLRCLKFLLET
jgi:hypothetical protein